MARRGLRDITSALTIGPYSAPLLTNRSAYGLLSDQLILTIPMPVIDYFFYSVCPRPPETSHFYLRRGAKRSLLLHRRKTSGL